MPSLIEPYRGRDLQHGNGVEQTWRANDSLESLARAFGQTVYDLDARTKYEIEIRAHNRSENLIGVSVWEIDGFVPGQPDSGQPVNRLELDAVKITPSDGFNVYRGYFTTKENGAVRLAAKIEGKNPVLPGTLIWDYWRLSPYVEELPNLLRNGDFSLWPKDALLPPPWFLAEANDYPNTECTIKRIAAPGLDSGNALWQEWRETDGQASKPAVLSRVAIGLKPGTVHKLITRARNESNSNIVVSAWELLDYNPDDPNSMRIGEQIHANVVRVPPSRSFDNYSGRFQTGDTGIVLFRTALEEPASATLPVSVVWDAWKLIRDEGSGGSP